MLGGIIAGALGQGAQTVQGLAQGQIDLNDKQQLASFQSQLETDRATQAARLAQTINQENVMYGLSPDVTAAKNTAAASATRSQAATSIEPDVLNATNTVEASKPREIPFGGELHQNVNGKDVLLAKNQTAVEAYRRAPAGSASANNFSAKEVDDGLTSLTGLVEKGFTDPATTKTPPALTNIASSAYIGYVQGGETPAAARARALSDTTNAYQSAMAVMQSEKYKDVVKGDINAALAIAAQLRQPKAAAAPAPDAAAGPGLVNGARTPAAQTTPPAPDPDADAPVPSFTAARAARESRGRAAPAAAPKPDTGKQTADAQEAFAAAQGNPRAASQLQASPLFDFLSSDEKLAISKLVNGR